MSNKIMLILKWAIYGDRLIINWTIYDSESDQPGTNLSLFRQSMVNLFLYGGTRVCPCTHPPSVSVDDDQLGINLSFLWQSMINLFLYERVGPCFCIHASIRPSLSDGEHQRRESQGGDGEECDGADGAGGGPVRDSLHSGLHRLLPAGQRPHAQPAGRHLQRDIQQSIRQVCTVLVEL